MSLDAVSQRAQSRHVHPGKAEAGESPKAKRRDERIAEREAE
jgi:hypothetical protein